jgi:organic radical activating enzyme
MTTSCHHPLPHKVSVEEVAANPKALHNTAQKKAERQMMQVGARPSGCEYCWKIEDIGRDNISDRVYKTVIYSDEDLDNAYNTPANTDVDLQTLEIAFDRTCQFACSYCNPAFSTTWVNDIKRNGPYTGLNSDGRGHFTHAHDSAQLYRFGDTNPYVDAFHAWWESDLHRTLKELRITGGEPLMSGETWRLLEWFKQNKGRSQTRLAINSNLGTQVDVDRLLAAVEGVTVDLYTSNESMGQQSEYIRDGIVFSDWTHNVERLLESRKFRGLHVMSTINALCLDSLTKFLELVHNWKIQYGKDSINFSLNILRFPSFQSPLVLPDGLRTIYKNRLQSWHTTNCASEFLHEYELNQLQRLIDYLDIVKTPHAGAAEQSLLQRDFKQFYTQYDQRRGKNFTETFPAIADWYTQL